MLLTRCWTSLQLLTALFFEPHIIKQNFELIITHNLDLGCKLKIMSNNRQKKRVCEGSDSGSNIILLNQCCYSTEIVIPNNWDDDSAPPSPKKIPELTISCSSVANTERYLEQQCNKTKVSKYLRKSVDNLYNMDLGKSQTGDLVLTTIEDIDHLAVESDNFWSSFVIMEAVIGLKQMTGG